MLSRHNLGRIDTDWERRSLFRKQRRLAGKIWLVLAALLAVAVYQTRLDIPDLLLDGFKLIAHLAPAPTPGHGAEHAPALDGSVER